jgi:DNA-binding CsgD family transcriptional regulator
MLASGKSLERACAHMNVAKETGRNQLKSIFAKTRTNRQVELVLVLGSVMSATEYRARRNPNGS